MGKMRMFQLLLNQEMKKGQENDWKVSFTTWVVPTQEEETHSTISKPPSTFRAALAHVWKDWLSILVSLPGVSAWDSEPSSPDESQEGGRKIKGNPQLASDFIWIILISIMSLNLTTFVFFAPLYIDFSAACIVASCLGSSTWASSISRP